MSQMIESFLQAATPALRAQPVELEEAPPADAAGAPLLRDAHPLHAVRIRLQVCVGEAAMTVGQLMSARENELLVLDRTVDQPVDLLLEGKVVARGELVAMDDGAFALRVTELPLPLKF
jgi:flagellar motor switch protein FliN/FliY